MPDRVIRDEILESERWLSLKDVSDRMAFICLILSADDFGNFPAGTYRLARLFDGPVGECTEQRAAKILQELVEAELVVLYDVSNPNARLGSRLDPPTLRYLHIPRFRQRLRFPKRHYPLPPWQEDAYDPDVTKYEWQKRIRPSILERDGHECVVCGTKDFLTVDHIIPLSHGGKSSFENLITMCRPCNMKKSTKTVGVHVYQEVARKRNITMKSSEHQHDFNGTPEEKRSEEKRGELNPPVGPPKGGHSPENRGKPKKQKREAVTFDAWNAACREAGVKHIPETDAVWKFADDVGLPDDYVRLTWFAFRDRYRGEAKRYRDWPAVFRRAVKANWFRLWFLDGEQYALTSTGKVRLREMTAAKRVPA